jgi:hypothetical protein
MVARKDQTPTLPILNAVDSLYSQIRKNHPEVPPATFVVGAKGKTARRSVHGHFHANQWEGSAAHEIMLSGESLARGAVPTLGTLIHEAAHAAAFASGVKDTSNNGRYHNKKFKEIAESMGIELEQGNTIGWSITSVPDATVERYAKGVAALAETLTAWRKTPVEALTAPAKPRRTTKFAIDCGCGNPVTVSKIWFSEHGDITCGDCLEVFAPVE